MTLYFVAFVISLLFAAHLVEIQAPASAILGTVTRGMGMLKPAVRIPNRQKALLSLAGAHAGARMGGGVQNLLNFGNNAKNAISSGKMGPNHLGLRHTFHTNLEPVMANKQKVSPMFSYIADDMEVAYPKYFYGPEKVAQIKESLIDQYKRFNQDAMPSEALRNKFEEIATGNVDFPSPYRLVEMMKNLEPVEKVPKNEKSFFRLTFGFDYVPYEPLVEPKVDQQQIAEEVQRSIDIMINGHEPTVIPERRVKSRSHVDTYDLFRLMYGFDLREKLRSAHVKHPKHKHNLLEFFHKKRENLMHKFDQFMNHKHGDHAEKEKETEETDLSKSFKENFRRFAPDPWLFAWAMIPQIGRNLLIKKAAEFIGAIKAAKPGDTHVVDLRKMYAEILSVPDTLAQKRIVQFFALVQNDFDRLTEFLEENYAQLFQALADGGLPAMKEELEHYLEVWERARWEDQENLAHIWPKLEWFYAKLNKFNNKEDQTVFALNVSMLMNHMALRSAQGDVRGKLALVPLLFYVFAGLPELPDAAPYEVFDRELEQDVLENPAFFKAIGEALGPAKLLVH